VFAMEKAIGISARRSLPHLRQAKRFDKWFGKRAVAGVADPGSASAVTARGYNAAHRAQRRKRGPVILWDDTFVRYHDHTSELPRSQCWKLSGSRFRSQRTGAAVGDRRLAREISMPRQSSPPTTSLNSHSKLSTIGPPILFLEPSCWSMFVEKIIAS